MLEKRLTSQGIIPMPLTLLGKAGAVRKNWQPIAEVDQTTVHLAKEKQE
jgi:hypothetical protein